jgi:hypothetical protein
MHSSFHLLRVRVRVRVRGRGRGRGRVRVRVRLHSSFHRVKWLPCSPAGGASRRVRVRSRSKHNPS